MCCVRRFAVPRKCSLLAGGTDLLVHLRASPDLSPDMIDLSGVKELKNIEIHRDPMEIGACATFSQIEGHPLVQERFSALARGHGLARQFACGAARRLGTSATASRHVLSSRAVFLRSARSGVLCSSGVRRYSPRGSRRPREDSLHADQYIAHVLLRFRALSFFVKTGSREGRRHLETQPRSALSSGRGVCGFRRSLRTSPIRMEAAEAVLDRRDWTEANHAAFLDALSDEVERAIPGRASPRSSALPYGLGDDLWTAARRSPVAELKYVGRDVQDDIVEEHPGRMKYMGDRMQGGAAHAPASRVKFARGASSLRRLEAERMPGVLRVFSRRTIRGKRFSLARSLSPRPDRFAGSPILYGQTALRRRRILDDCSPRTRKPPAQPPPSRSV